jgi:hypothetical protein
VSVIGKLPPETVKPAPLAATLFSVRFPLPEDVTVNVFDVAVFKATAPNETLVALTVIAGEDEVDGAIFTAKVFQVQPYPATSVTVCADLTDATAAVNCALL